MAKKDNQLELAMIGQDLDQLLYDYWVFVKRTVVKHVRASEGGPVNYVASIISREIPEIRPAVIDPFDYSSITTKPLDGSQLDALAAGKAHYDNLSDFFDSKSHHQIELKDAMAGKDGLTETERNRLKADVPKLSALITQFGKVHRQIEGNFKGATKIESNDPKNPGTNQKDRPDTKSLTDPTGGTKMSDNSSHDNTCSADALQGIVDAISRLQSDASGGQSGGVGSASNAYNLFGSELDQKLQTTLGMPNLASDGALAMDPDDLLNKLFDGLDRSVVVTQTEGGSQFQFNPLKARGSALGSEMNALGAQAVTADHIRALKAPILDNLYRLQNEDYCCDHEKEVGELCRSIEDSLDTLSYEASAEAGAFDNWVSSIFEQMTRDLLDLLHHYGIKSKNDGIGFAELAPKLCKSMKRTFRVLGIKTSKKRTKKNPEIGILTAEKNDKAVSAILLDFGTMYRMLLNDGSLGPQLGRIRALNDAISASVISARNALATAGISIEDQSVSFSGDETAQTNTISLRRLMGWIESESLMARSVLLKPNLHSRDLRRLKIARDTQHRALSQIVGGNFPTINNNHYAVGRRHLRELNGHLAALVDLLDSIVSTQTPIQQPEKSAVLK